MTTLRHLFFCLLITMALLFEAGRVYAQNNITTTYLSEADKFLRAKNYGKAESLYNAVLKNIEGQPYQDNADKEKSWLENDTSIIKIRALIGLGNLYLETDKLEQAQPTLEKLGKLMPNHPKYAAPNYAAMLALQYAILNRKKGNLSKSEELYKYALNISEKEDGLVNQRRQIILEDLAKIYETQGRNAEMEVLNNQAKAIQEKLLPCNNLPPERFEAFISSLQKKIRKKWHPPEQYNTKLRAVALFHLKQDGSTSDIKLQHATNIVDFDNSSIAAIQKAAPFKNVPRFCEDFITVQFIFDYEPFKAKK